MDMARAIRAGPAEELLPVPVRRLVGPDLGGDDRLVERDADQLLRGGDVVGIRVREDRKAPAASASLLERAAYLPERLPGWQRVGQGRRIVELDALLIPETLERPGQYLPVRELAICFELGLELVIPVQKPAGLPLAEDPRELTANPAVPVDERPVAVECRPALHRARA